jgi:hypothetical protein
MKKYRFFFILLIFGVYSRPDLAQTIHHNELAKLFSDPVVLNPVEDISEIEIEGFGKLKKQLSEAQKKFSTDLLQLIEPKFLPLATSLSSHIETMKKHNQFKPFEYASNFGEAISEGEVYVYIYLHNGNATSVIDGTVSEVTDREERNNLAVAWVKVKDLEKLAFLTSVRTIRTVYPPVTRIGSVITEGDVLHRTENVRDTYGADGTGIKIGVISDGVDSRDEAQGTGDLPPDDDGLTVLSNTQGGDEGTAMLEIVYDMVPSAELYFHDHGANTVAFNTAIDNLVTAGCNIICDDIGWIAQSFYEDGTIAYHLNSVLAVNDIIYVSACGNAAQSHYQGDFYPIGSQPSQHDFSEGGTTGYYLYVNIPAGGNVMVILQWNDQFGASGNDYDMGLYSFDQSAFVQVSVFEQNGDDDPLEFLDYTATSSGTSNDYAIVVEKYLGDDVNLEVFIYPDGIAQNYINNIKPQDAIFGHAAVNGVVSVGACHKDTPDSLEYFSSWGPSTIEYPAPEIRQTPSTVGVDFVSVTGAGGFPTSFGGTSAATPHIVSVFAQAWSEAMDSSANGIKQLLFDWPEDLGTAGYDNLYGYGRGDALNIFDNVLPVELSSFTAKATQSGVLLKWRTESELDNYGFEILRSAQNDSSWVMLDFVEGHGNSNSPKEYSYTDKNVKYGKYAYRLKQIDTDGDYEYSNTIEVDAGLVPNGFVLEQNYPNPFNPVTTIKFALAETQEAELKIYDVLGNEIESLFKANAEAGKVYEIEFNATLLPSGIYFYALRTVSNYTIRKMVLLK